MKGLTEKLVRELSKAKNEPSWVLEMRLRGLKAWNSLEMPSYLPDISELNLAEIETYVRPKTEMISNWDEVPKEIRETFDSLGIPEAEKENLAGVGAQYDSEMVYHNIKREVEKTGVVYLPIEEALRSKKYEKLVREHFLKLVPPEDHKFQALHAAVFSGGSFIYVPPETEVEFPLQSYYRLNAPGAGQFEHTLIIVDEGASLHFIEGCSAPKYNVANLHAGCVEVYVGKNAKMKFSTVESWSKNMYNLNTKRAIVEEGGEILWVTGNFGSKVSMLYPTTVLNGTGAKAEYIGVSLASSGQNLDTGAKVIHLSSDTCSTIDMRSIVKDGGISTTRTLAYVAPGVSGVKSYTNCKSLILDSESVSNAIPEVKVLSDGAEVAHEASVGKLSEEALFYLQSKGISEEKARGMLVSGFTTEVSKELPVEYAMEMNNLIKMEIEGTA